MMNRHLLFIAKRLLEIGIGTSLLLALIIHFLGGFSETFLGVYVGASRISDPIHVLLLLLLIRILLPMEWKSALLVLVSLAFAFVLLEAGVRLAAYLAENRADNRIRSRSEAAAESKTRGARALGEIIRTSADPDIIYELIPNVTASFMGQPMSINKYGFRGPPHAPEPKGDAVRIVGLGDSVMFGWGVGEGKSYLDLLEDHLRQEYPDTEWQVVNSAVPGYNTCMEVATLRSRLLCYKPDLVIIDFVGNDLQLPNFILEPISPLTLKRSFLLDFIRDRLRHLPWDPLHRLAQAPKDPFGGGFVDDPEIVPPGYRHLVGTEGFLRCMSELGRLGVTFGFPVVVLCIRTLPDELKAACIEQGLLVLETELMGWGEEDHGEYEGKDPAAAEARRQLDGFLRSTGIERYMGSPLSVGKVDPHPSALGHKGMEMALFTYLEDAGLIDDLQRGKTRPVSPTIETHQTQ